MSDDDDLYSSLESIEIPHENPKSSLSWTEQEASGRGKQLDFEDDSSDAVSSSASEAEEWQGRPDSPDLPPEYWQVQRLVKYIKAGNPTATIIALSSLRDFPLENRFVQLAIKDSGGLEVLLNILETDESPCKRASLMVIKEITSSPEISRSIFNMRGLETLVKCLADPSKEIKILTAETISNICKIKKARRAMRKSDGISRLVDMLDFENGSYKSYPPGGEWDFDVPRYGGMALWSLAKSTKNREAIRRAGAIPVLAKLMKTKEVSVIIPTVGILQECASEPEFRSAICREGLLADFVSGLQSSSSELVQFCAKAIYMCAEDEKSRKIVFELRAIDPLMSIIQDSNLRENKGLLAAATGAIWKCASAICKTRRYLEKGLVELLVSLLEFEPEEVLINVAGTIEEIAKTDISYACSVKMASGIPLLIKLLTINNQELLVNATRAVGALARDTESRLEMERLDAFRLVWSLLKHPSTFVQSSAAWAICPYVQSSKASSEMVRNYVGGLEALVQLLMSDNIYVQAAVCEAVAAIAANTENLAIMSDYGVVQFLARLTHMPRESDLLRRCLATAISQCCTWGQNSMEFGQLKAVSPICFYLKSKKPAVLREATKALAALSSDPRNCITIHQCGIVGRLIVLTGSLDEDLRNAAACVMANIRSLALTTEKIRFQQYRTKSRFDLGKSVLD